MEEEIAAYSDNYDFISDSSDGASDDEIDSPSNQFYEVLTKDSLIKAQRECIQRVVDFLDISEQNAKTLLIHHRWDVDKLFASFVDKGEHQLFGEAGVTILKQTNVLSSLSPSTPATCDICTDDAPADTFTALNCGHCFCNNCWTEHFIVKISEGHSKHIRCIAYKCNTICDEAMIQNFVSKRDSLLAARFERSLLDSFVEDNKLAKWCPSVPHCGNAVCLRDTGCYEVECLCGEQFCSNCLSQVHSPCSCMMWEQWNKRCQINSHDEKTQEWVVVNSRPCPDCSKPVYRDGGCARMFCVCGLSFCWWCGHRHYVNSIWGTFDAVHKCSPNIKEENLVLETQQDLQQFGHYFESYKAHSDSFKKEKNLKERVDYKILNCESKKLEMKDFSWVMDGFHALLKSRRILFCSYVFAYYRFGDKKKELQGKLFEEQQQQLKINVHRMSEILEEPFDEYSDSRLVDTKMRVLNLSSTVLKLSKDLLSFSDKEQEADATIIEEKHKNHLFDMIGAQMKWSIVFILVPAIGFIISSRHKK